MVCPKCSSEMEAGFLQTDRSHPITWVARLLPMGLGYWKKDAEIVSSDADFGLTVVRAHICRRCKLVVGDYSDQE